MAIHADYVARCDEDITKGSLQSRVHLGALHDCPDVRLLPLQRNGFEQGFRLHRGNDVAVLAEALALHVRLALAQQLQATLGVVADWQKRSLNGTSNATRRMVRRMQRKKLHTATRRTFAESASVTTVATNMRSCHNMNDTNIIHSAMFRREAEAVHLARCGGS